MWPKGSLVPKDELKAQGFVLVYPDTKSKYTDNKKGFLFSNTYAMENIMK